MKQKIISRIEDIGQALILCSRLFNDNNEPQKYTKIAVMFDELRILCEDNIYFSVKEVKEEFNNNINNKYIKKDIEILENIVDNYFKNILRNYMEKSSLYKFLPKTNKDDFVEYLYLNPDLFEKSINMILNKKGNFEKFIQKEISALC